MKKQLFTASLTFLALSHMSLHATDLSWKGGDGVWDLGIYSEPYSGSWPSGGTWTGAANWESGTTYWTNQGSGTITATTGATGPGSGGRDAAIFDVAGGGRIEVSDVTDIRPQGIFGGVVSFRASGYELYSDSLDGARIEMNFSSGLEVRSGVTAKVGSGINYVLSGGDEVSGGGTLELAGSLWRTSSGVLRVVEGTTINVLEGGKLGGDFLGNNIFIGTNGPGVLNVNGGDVNVGNGTQNRSLVLGTASNSDGTVVNLNSGMITVKSNATSGVVLGASNIGSGTVEFNLNGGVLQTPGIRSEAGNAIFRFNGGLLQTINDSLNVFTGVDAVYVGQQGARVSSGDGFGGYAAIYEKPLLSDPALGSQKDGGLIKQDFGTITLAPGTNYNGDTVVERGVLVVPDAFFDASCSVQLGPNGRLELNFDGVATVSTFYINGKPQSIGTWGGVDSGATHITQQISGNGILEVTGAGPALPELVAAQGPNVGREYDEAIVASIPDPLVMENGQPVTSAEQWMESRRGEILELFREHVYGHNAVERPEDLSFTVEGPWSVGGDAAGRATKSRITITYRKDGKEGSFPLYILTPTWLDKPKGIFLLININSEGNTTHPENNGRILPGVDIINRGYVAASFYKNNLSIDNEDDAFNSGVFEVFGPTGSPVNDRYPERPSNAWGTIGAWSWGASRSIDYFKSVPLLQDIPIAVVGHSRGGKAALWTGAQDERVDLTISNSSGSTGAAMARTKGGESIKRINDDFAHWFADNYKNYNERETELPVDQHMLMALIAPRHLYVQSSFTDYWADPVAEFESALRAGPVYDLFGLNIVDARWRPWANDPKHAGDIGYHARGEGFPGDTGTGGSHSLRRYDWDQYLDYADRHLSNYGSSIRNWRSDNSLNIHGMDDLKDFSGDGTPNLLKYAFNYPVDEVAQVMEPGGTSGLPRFSSQSGNLTFEHLRRSPDSNPGIEYRFEESPDLKFWTPWTPSGQAVTIDANWERITYQLAPLASEAKKFYRLRILRDSF
ncbi:hypothetical protein [Cerasicoccus fimbriatus]|uniref:glucuronyl esterase domain-containing protein n=1 Tax=Cerasicoccus fimbriatus TaxID=3014554 RepID=UPI0022B441F9|nr:hypothetical protein [Cerasicoccus sp. TK19100]